MQIGSWKNKWYLFREIIQGMLMMAVTVRIFFLFQHLVSIKGREFHNQLVKSWEWFHSELSARIRNLFEAVAARANGQDMMLCCSVGTSLFFTYTSLSSYTTWQWCTFYPILRKCKHHNMKEYLCLLQIPAPIWELYIHL